MNEQQLVSKVMANMSWGRNTKCQQENRDIHQVNGLILKGPIDVVFVRSNTPMLVILGETQKAIDSINTSFRGNKLLIKREGSITNNIITRNNYSIKVSAGGNVTINGKSINGNEQSHGKAVVAISLPEIEQINIHGSSDIQLNDLLQASLTLNIAGSGDVEASGEINDIKVNIAGSGDVDAEDLIAQHATLSIAGSGDANLHAKQSACVTIVGSGDAKIYGKPHRVSEQVTGSGKVKFK